MDILYFIGFNFIIYSFWGWIIEELYCFCINKNFKKEGFLFGPIKPMCGVAMTTLVVLYEYLNTPTAYMVILFFIIPSIVEYSSGYLLKNLFNKTYWSYSNLKFNINGYVCLRFSVYWMVLSFFGVYFLQNVLNELYYAVNGVLSKFVIAIINILVILDIAERVKNYNTYFTKK